MRISDSFEMKLFLGLLICCSHSMYSDGNVFSITESQMYDVVDVMCNYMKRENRHLWDAVIDCHKPVADEVNFYFITKLSTIRPT